MPRKSLHQQATSSIKDRIARAMPDLTPSHRTMADYVLAHSFRAATMTIDELAEAASVSTATVNRFAHKLGFSGFPAFRAAITAASSAASFRESTAHVSGWHPAPYRHGSKSPPPISIRASAGSRHASPPSGAETTWT